MGRKVTGEIKIYRETMNDVLKAYGWQVTKLSETMGKDPSWLNQRFYPRGYAGFSEMEMIALTSLIGCKREDLTALPISPEGKAKERKAESDKRPTEYTIDDAVSEVQNLAAEMAAGFIEIRKDRPTATKQDALYDLIRNSVKMIHTDIMTLVQAVRGDGQ